MQALRKIVLDKDIPIPLYYQLKKQILGLIEESVLVDGDMLPAENELCELLHVSRPTIRQAFGELVAEGYLHRYKGKGTFVSKPKVEERFFSKLESFHQEMIQKGMVPHTEVLELAKIPAKPEVNEKLKISMDAPLIYLSRVRSADKIPLVYVETYLSYEQCKKLLDVDFTTISLYDSLDSICNLHVSRVLREIEAANVRRKEAELLQIAQNKAICLVKTVAYPKDSDQPIEYSVARYRGDRNKFTVEIYR